MLVMGQMTTPFAIYTAMPRREVPMSFATLEELGLGGSVVCIEEKDGGELELLELFRGLQEV